MAAYCAAKLVSLLSPWTLILFLSLPVLMRVCALSLFRLSVSVSVSVSSPAACCSWVRAFFILILDFNSLTSTHKAELLLQLRAHPSNAPLNDTPQKSAMFFLKSKRTILPKLIHLAQDAPPRKRRRAGDGGGPSFSASSFHHLHRPPAPAAAATAHLPARCRRTRRSDSRSRRGSSRRIIGGHKIFGLPKGRRGFSQ